MIMDTRRIVGFDIARALAIFGMIIINFKVTLNANEGSTILLWFSSLFEGRASALFVILAGVGITFLTNRALKSGDNRIIQQARIGIIKRGMLLIIIGLSYTPIWEADILHFYGFYFLIAAMLFTFDSKKLLIFAWVFMLVFPVLVMVFDYDKGWNWTTYHYAGFWTLDGIIRRILFNGFHPVFPWVAFLIFGMWLGRQNLSATKVRIRLLTCSLIVWIFIETFFYWLRRTFTNTVELGLTTEELNLLLSTSVMPPFPQYILAAGSLATILIIMSIILAERYQHARLTRWLCKTGQMSLTIYIAHVVIGMGFLELIGKLENQNIEFAMLSASIFCIMAVIGSVFWLSHFKTGPLEWVFRKIAKSASN
ncbi:hypothetical protein MNBD_GAMMA03-81 [hydrothermal vent metagenome]|uniref:DUF418 domain-containing protein n=1 Tax=hydrothermal vent metagenome TaxID=652676 RepID=A0A3B0WCK4_9ZZZZ